MADTATNELTPFLADHGRAELGSEGIDRILAAVRQHLGMEIAFVGRYTHDDHRELTHVSTDLPLPQGPGFKEPREDSFCFHILEGRLPSLIHDAADYPAAGELPITAMLPVGCHLNVPLTFSDGTVYGSFCALSRAPDRSITERDMGVLSAFAALALEHIERDVGADLESAHSREKIRQVIERRELAIHHQPIHALLTGEPMGVECLARFPDAGTRGPDAWFDQAAKVGLGLDLETHAVACAVNTLSSLPLGKYMSVNASPELILSGRLHDLLGKGDRERLVVEVTEHTRVASYRELAEALRALKPKARIAIDDVGAGYAGLRHIVDLAPDILKLDMSLTRDVHRDKARNALTGAMVRFAAEIDAVLVAEGIECAEEAQALARLGVTYGQGWHYAKPMPVVNAQRHMLGMAQEADMPVEVVPEAKMKRIRRSA